MAKLVVFTGPMFSKKTGRLIDELEKAELAGKKVICLKPKLDNRVEEKEIASRKKPSGKTCDFEKGDTYPAFSIETEKEARKIIAEECPSVIGIDEAQFFEPWMFKLIQELVDNHPRENFEIFACGLDMDASKKPFGIVPQLLAIADEVVKLKAVCSRCGHPANLTAKIAGSKAQVEVGNSDKYIPTCPCCHKMPPK